MFLTKSKKLAKAIIEGKSLVEVKEIAMEVIIANPRRNCNFENDVIDLRSENELRGFKEDLKEIEASTTIISFNGVREERQDYWNTDKLTLS